MTDDSCSNRPRLDAVTGEAPKRKLKKMVFSALAVQGVVGLAAMVVSAQAHGNASSHLGAQLDWDFDNFVVRRETLTNPTSPTASLLRDLAGRQAALSNEISTRRQDFDAQRDSLSDRVLKLEDARRSIEGGAYLNNRLQQLTNTLTLRPSTRKVLDLLAGGRGQEASTAIESVSADPLTVLTEYSLVQLDLINYSAVDGFSTPAMIPEIVAVSRAGLAYQRARLPADVAIGASILHNVASAAAPDTGSATAEQQSIGRDAAAEALAIRTQLGETKAIGMAEYMVGIYQYRDRRFADAERTFISARGKLNSTPPNEQQAWATLFLGYSQLALGKAEGQQLVNEARATFGQIGSSYGQRYIVAGIGRNQ